MRFLTKLLIDWPASVAHHFLWAGPLVARLVGGYVFMLTGWNKLHSLPRMIQNFTEWGIPFPQIMTPLASGIECFGGLFLILGLFTRLSGGALAVVMLVAIKVAKADQIESLESLLGFEETIYFALFTWLAIAGAGKASLDHLLHRGPSRTE